MDGDRRGRKQRTGIRRRCSINKRTAGGRGRWGDERMPVHRARLGASLSHVLCLGVRLVFVVAAAVVFFRT